MSVGPPNWWLLNRMVHITNNTLEIIERSDKKVLGNILNNDNTISGNNSFTGDNTFEGNSSFTDVVIDGNLSGNTQLNIQSNVVIHGEITFNDETTFNGNIISNNTLNIESNVSISNSLTVNDASTFNQTLNVDNGGITLGNTSTFNGSVTFSGNVTVLSSLNGNSATLTENVSATIIHW